MKTIKLHFGLLISICALFLGTFTLSNCNTALGERLNLDPPMVTITEPYAMQSIKDEATLVIRGIAQDRDEIVTIKVTVEKTKDPSNMDALDYIKEFIGETGVWSAKTKTIDILDQGWKGVNLVEWFIEIPMGDADNGEYIISANAINNVHNEGPATQQRVVVDKEPPTVTITLPDLKTPTELNAYKARDTTCLDKLYNQSVKIQYEATDDFSIAGLELTLLDEANNIYYQQPVEEAKRSGNITVYAKDIVNPVTGKIPGDEIGDKIYLRIKSKAWDLAGNEKEEEHKYFVWWPYADWPWVGDDLGDATSSLNKTEVYPEQTVYGQAYDNQGVKSVTFSVFGGSGYTVVVLPQSTQINKPLPGIENPSGFFTFSFDAPKTPGSYKIETITEDIYEHITTQEFYFKVKDPPGLDPLLVGFAGSSSAGLYGLTNPTINIHLNVRETIQVNNNATLLLNVNKANSQPAFAALTSGNGTQKLIFTYTVQAGDGCDELNIEGINIATMTKPPADGGGTVPWPNTLEILPGREFKVMNGGIQISTSSPTYNSHSTTLTNNTLTITFTSALDISKGSGDITLTQQDTTSAPYLAPAVLTKAEYLKFGGDAALGAYYERGINSASASGVADTSEKYVLKYGTNTDDTDVITALKGQKADKIIIAVVSSAVTLNNKTLSINLSDTYGFAPRVKGVSYIITYEAGIIKDAQNNKVAAATGNSRIFSVAGVNKPYIRVEKKREEIRAASTGTMLSVTGVTQVLTTGSFWITNANFVIQANKPTSAGNWVQVPPFRIGNNKNRNNTEVTVSTTSQTNYISAQQGYSIVGDSNDADGGGLWRNIANNNLYCFSWWIGDNGGNSQWTRIYTQATVNTNTAQFWINPYANPLYFNFTDSGEAPGFYVGTNGRNPMWINTNSGTQSTANNPGTGYILIGSLRTEATCETTAVPAKTTAIQPLTVGVKIDCQTPGATVRYSTSSATGSPYAGGFGRDGESGHPTKPSFSMPTTSTTTIARNASFTLGKADDLNGYIYGIRAEATNNSITELAYEKATRSVIMFNNIAEAVNWSNPKDGTNSLTSRTTALGGGRTLQLWLRGGDDLSGSSRTPGFPMSWSDEDYTGARLMSGIDGAGTWYWVSWEISTQAYFHFVAGTTTTVAETIKGPLEWGWAKNAWAFQHTEYPLYPGCCLFFTRNTRVTHPATENFEFYDNFSGSRP
jgi:hypothetical protein